MQSDGPGSATLDGRSATLDDRSTTLDDRSTTLGGRVGVQRGARVPLVLPPPPVDQVLLCVAQVRSWSAGRGGGFLPLRCQGARSLYPGLRVLEFYYLSAGSWVVSGPCPIIDDAGVRGCPD